MARPRIKTPERLIANRTARGESAATIRAALGSKSPSASTLKRRQREIRGTAVATLPSSPKRIVAPDPEPAPDEHARLLHEYAHAESGTEAYPLALALARLERPDFARWVDEGLPVPAALSNDDPVAAELFGTPEGLAHLASRTNENDWRAAAALLESALAILRAQGPEWQRNHSGPNGDKNVRTGR